MLDFTGKIAFVTGASRGLGRAIAIALGRAGADVAIAHLDNEPERRGAQDVVSKLKAFGRKAIPFAQDVTDPVSCENAARSFLGSFGRLDVLVNNAGVLQRTFALEATPDDFDLCSAVNVKGIWNATKPFLEHFEANKSGVIVNIASIGGRRGKVLMPYDASKAAAISVTQSLAQMLGPWNVNVNAVCPGPVVTDLWNRLEVDGLEREELVKFEDFLKDVPLNRLSTPDDVANAVLFLASPMASNITGQSLNVDGGFAAN